MSVILRTVSLDILEVRVISRRYRHMVADRVTANNKTTGMDARASDISLQHFGILNGVPQLRVGRVFCLSQFWSTFDGIRKVHFHAVRQTVGNGLDQIVHNLQWHFLHTRHIFERVLRCHGGIRNDVGTVLMPILILHPFQHFTTSIIIEVSINIRQ